MKNETKDPWTKTPVALAAAVLLAASTIDAQEPPQCVVTALQARRSCERSAAADFWLQRGKCSNLPTAAERIACTDAAREELQDALAECQAIHAERLDICEALGGGVYQADIDPASFVAVIDNPYLPLIPGTTRTYEKQTDEGLERIVVEATHGTEEVLGVTCLVVRDVVTLDGVVIEDTLDWYAQDVAGNVWYFGELSMAFEDGVLASLEGSWRAGVDGAVPGIVMQANPTLGAVYRQEFLLGEAEDMGAILSLSESVSVPTGTYTDCLLTLDFTPLEPGHVEHKVYAPGVGFVYELNPETGEELQLVSVVTQ